jgi:hypothetical protein
MVVKASSFHSQNRCPNRPSFSPQRELRAIGWAVSKVIMVPDEVAAIAKEVAALSRWAGRL